MKTLIHVNQHVIRANKKHGRNDPMITVKRGRRNDYCHEVVIMGPAKVVSQSKPLACGARVWMETDSKVKLVRMRACQRKRTT